MCPEGDHSYFYQTLVKVEDLLNLITLFELLYIEVSLGVGPVIAPTSAGWRDLGSNGFGDKSCDLRLFKSCREALISFLEILVEILAITRTFYDKTSQLIRILSKIAKFRLAEVTELKSA